MRRDVRQRVSYEKKRKKLAAILCLVASPVLLLAGTLLWGSGQYYWFSFLLLLLTMVPFFLRLERRRPRARELVLLAVFSALTVAISLLCTVTIPIKAGSALVIVAGIALGPEAGFLVGALSRFVLNFYQGQGAWTPWQMFAWGLLGFLAGLCFSGISLKKEEEGKALSILAPLAGLALAGVAAYLCYLFFPDGTSFVGWRLYVFGALGLGLGAVFLRKKLPIHKITLTLFSFCTIFVLYGGIMNLCSLVTLTSLSGGEEVSLSALKALYVSGAPYDCLHGASAAAFLFFFGERLIRALERIKIKYGFYR